MQPTDDLIARDGPTAERDTIVIEDDLLREGFTQVPNLLLKRTDISHGAKIAYAMLLSYAWGAEKCFPGQARLATDLGVERKAVIRYLQELKDKGIITVTRRGMGKTNVYKLPRLTDVPLLGHQEVPRPGHQEVRSVGQKEYAEKNTKNVNLSNFEGSHDKLETGERTEASSTPAEPGIAGTDDPAPASERGAPVPLGEILRLRAAAVSRIGNTASHPVPSAVDETPPRRRGRSSGDSEERERLRAFLTDFALELGDEAPLSSTITRALNIFKAAGIPPEQWSDALYQARGRTQEHTAQIRKTAGDGGTGLRRKNKVPYFLATLESLVGLRPEPAERSRRRESSS